MRTTAALLLIKKLFINSELLKCKLPEMVVLSWLMK